MEVGEVKLISDGNGGTLYAKLTDVDRYYVHYRVRKSNRGRWSAQLHDASRRKFKDLIDAANSH